MALGALAFYLLRDQINNGITLDHFTRSKPNAEKIKEPVVPYPGWNDKKRQRALAVVIDNAPEARPQSGLEQADIIIELPVEGGLTRLLAIISGENQELVGPIRSARSYIVDLAREYNSILVHAGGSPDALETIDREGIENLDEIYGNSEAAAAFWRVPDRPKPHNLYASSDSLRRSAKALKYDLGTPPPQHPTFKPDTEMTGESISDVTIFYANRKSLVRYVFNKEKRVFERYMEEKPHLTAKGEQLTGANVIVQYVPYQYIDGDGRLQLIMHGSGQALVFSDGKVIKGLWQKNPGGHARYTDLKGKTIALMEGPTWIEVVPKGTRVEY
jgi:hypothetical protein